MTDISAHILVVDDDPMIRKMLRQLFEGEGYKVTEAGNAAEASTGLAAGANLITLDLNLGGSADGLEIAREVRQRSDIPIIMITGKGDMIDRVVGLEIGADDYISKPFHLREVLARVRTVLRRSEAHRPLAAQVQAGRQDPLIRFDGFVLDSGRRCLTSPDDSDIDLTSGEFDLLLVFAERAHRPLSRDQIMDLLKGHDWAPNDRSIDNMIARLRRKIEQATDGATLIKTVRGVGYSFTPARINRG